MEVIRPVDKAREDAPKNFCFVTFDKEEPAKQLVIKGFTSIKGHQVIISRVSLGSPVVVLSSPIILSQALHLLYLS